MSQHLAPDAVAANTKQRFKTPRQCRRDRVKSLDAMMARAAPALSRWGVRYRLFRRHTRVAFPQVEVTLPGLPAAFDGFRIAHISDLHYCTWCEASDYDELFGLVARLEPDLCVCTGDNVSFHAASIAPIVAKLGRLRAPHGTYAVLGNHDYWEGANETARCYDVHGIRLLVNEWDAVARDGESIVIAGVDDWASGEPDMGRTLERVPHGAPVVLLSHVPCAVHHPLASHVALVLSGHAHGGQVSFPIVGPLSLPRGASRRHLHGYHRTPRTQLYVSRGVGAAGLWFRWRAQPEVPVIILRRGPC